MKVRETAIQQNEEHLLSRMSEADRRLARKEREKRIERME